MSSYSLGEFDSLAESSVSSIAEDKVSVLGSAMMALDVLGDLEISVGGGEGLDISHKETKVAESEARKAEAEERKATSSSATATTYLTAAATGAGLGAFVGSVVPGLGTALGGGLGIVMGVAGAAYAAQQSE